jgi:hypothetical protein
MEQVVLEQCMKPPIRVADIMAMERQAEWCMRQYRVRHISSLLSPDGERMTCMFDAPDAEAVRNVLHQLNQPYEGLWAATLHGPAQVPVSERLPLVDAALVVVERAFPAPVDFASVQAVEERGAWCLEAYRVTFLRTYFSTDRRKMICLYGAPDAEHVRMAQTQAGMPLQRIWAATLYESHMG